MFYKEKNQTPTHFNPSSATLINAGTVLKGNVQSDTDLRIDGTVQGNVACSAKVIVGPNGHVEGDIRGTHADITGKVTGNIVVEELLQLREQGNVQGNISAVKLQIEPTATFNGLCQMNQPDNVIQMNTDEPARAQNL